MRKYVNRQIVITANTFKIKPVFTIVQMSILPVATMIELGAVAAGSINAQLAASVTGSIKKDGSRFIDLARGMSMGRTSSVDDMFEVSSVTKLIMVARRPIVVT